MFNYTSIEGFFFTQHNRLKIVFDMSHMVDIIKAELWVHCLLSSLCHKVCEKLMYNTLTLRDHKEIHKETSSAQ